MRPMLFSRKVQLAKHLQPISSESPIIVSNFFNSVFRFGTYQAFNVSFDICPKSQCPIFFQDAFTGSRNRPARMPHSLARYGAIRRSNGTNPYLMGSYLGGSNTQQGNVCIMVQSASPNEILRRVRSS